MKLKLFKNFNIGIWEIALIELLALHLVVNIFWIISSNAPVLWDSANHTYISILIVEKLKSFDLFGILHTSNYYPILIHFLTSLPLLIFGFSVKLAEFMGTVYFLLTLLIIYIYIKQTTKDGFIAFLTTGLFSFLPVIYDQSRLLMLDIPSVGVLFLTLYFLEKSEFLIKRKFALLAGLSAGLLLMTKWTPFLFLVLPFLITLFFFFKSKKKMVIIKNSLLGGVIFLITILPWYLANLNDILFLTKVYSVGDPKAHPQVLFSVENFVTYYKIFLYTQAAPLIALVSFVSLFIFPFLKTSATSVFNRKWFIYLMIAINYLFFTAILDKDGRFTIHLLVFICLIVAYTFLSLIKKWKKIGILILSSFSILVISYYFLLTIRPANLEGYKFSLNFPILGGLEFINLDDSLVKKIDSRDWQFSELIEDLKKINNDEETRMLVISEWGHFNPSNIRTYSFIAGLKNIIPTTPDLPYLIKNYKSDHFPNDTEVKNFIARNKYLLIAKENIGSPYLLNMKAMRQVQSYAFPETFLSCNSFRLDIAPAGTSCFVKAGEILSTTSDILVDDNSIQKDFKEVKGFSEVKCPFGCSFEFSQKTLGQDDQGPGLELRKTYTLPNGQMVDLFKILPSQNNSNLIN